MAGDRDEVFRAEDAGLLEDAAAHLVERQTVLRGVEALHAARLLHGLERDAANAGLLQREVDDGAELVVVDAPLDRDDERGGDAELVESVEGFLADRAEIGAAQLHERFASQRVELKVDLEVRHVVGQTFGELLVLGDADAVGVDHQVLDRRSLHISRTRKNSGWIVGSPPEICTTSGSFSLRTTQSSMTSICARVRNPCGAGHEPA